jgi:hypothetical protein
VVLAVVIVIVVIPIAIRMPTTLVFIPPSMNRVPAALARFVQLVAPMFGLLALIAVMLDGFVQLVIGFRNAPLAVIIRVHARSACKQQKARQSRGSKYGSPEERILRMSHGVGSPLSLMM